MYTIPSMSKSTQRPSDAFPGRLRLARTTRKLSQEELAERAQLQTSAISHFETGARKPSFDNLRRLADALAVTTDYLIGRVDQMEDTATADRVHRHLRQLSSKDLDFAERFLKSLADEAERKAKKKEG
ncbi:MAG: helix-turn-helix domain-containing protein [Vicinamibacteraceae bacterium]